MTKQYFQITHSEDDPQNPGYVWVLSGQQLIEEYGHMDALSILVGDHPTITAMKLS